MDMVFDKSSAKLALNMTEYIKQLPLFTVERHSLFLQ